MPAYVLLVVVGAMIFQSGTATVSGNELSRARSLFSSVNAATLTGFVLPTDVADYTTRGQWLALGLVIAGILFSFIAGGLAVIRIAKMPYRWWQVLAWAAAMLILASLVGGIFLSGDTNVFRGIFLGISALGNSGLHAQKLPAGDSMGVFAIVLPLAWLGGLGLPVLMESLDRIWGKTRLSRHSQTVWVWSCSVFVIAVALLTMLQWPGSLEGWRRAGVSAARHAINVRSAGFGFEFASYWPRTMQWVVIGLMLLGAAPAGTAGGIKVTTLAVIVRGARDALQGRTVYRPLGIAPTWVGVYVAMLCACLLGLLISEPQMSADRILFAGAAGAGNVGLSA